MTRVLCSSEIALIISETNCVRNIHRNDDAKKITLDIIDRMRAMRLFRNKSITVKLTTWNADEWHCIHSIRCEAIELATDFPNGFKCELHTLIWTGMDRLSQSQLKDQINRR